MAIIFGEDGPSNIWMRPSWRQGVSRLARHRYCGTSRSTSRSTSRPVKDQMSRRGVCWKLQGLQSTSPARAAAARLTTCRRLSHPFLSSSRPSCHNGSSTWSCCISHSGASKLRGMLKHALKHRALAVSAGPGSSGGQNGDLAAVYGHRGHGEPICRPGRDVPDPGSLPHVACMAAVSGILRRVVKYEHWDNTLTRSQTHPYAVPPPGGYGQQRRARALSPRLPASAPVNFNNEMNTC